jgi:thioredoxin 1
MGFSEIISTDQLTLIDFYATWCEPCKWVEPVLEDVKKKFSEKILIHKIDIDKQPDIARAHHVMSVPTLVLFKKGKELWRMRGFDTAPALIKIVEGFL